MATVIQPEDGELGLVESHTEIKVVSSDIRRIFGCRGTQLTVAASSDVIVKADAAERQAGAPRQTASSSRTANAPINYGSDDE